MRVFGGDASESPQRQTRVKAPGRESRIAAAARMEDERRGAGPAPAPRRGEPRTPHPAPSTCSTAGRRVGGGRAPGKEPSGPGALTVCQVLVRGLPELRAPCSVLSVHTQSSCVWPGASASTRRCLWSHTSDGYPPARLYTSDGQELNSSPSCTLSASPVCLAMHT